MNYTSLPTGAYVLLDVECNPNYFLCGFLDYATRVKWSVEISQDTTLDGACLLFCLYHFCTVGFNSNSYDIPMVCAALAGFDCEQLKDVSSAIVQENLGHSELEERFGFKIPKLNHIDMIEVAPLQASLKLYGARMHSATIQDLPYPHDKYLTRVEGGNVKEYNGNDLELSHDLFAELYDVIQLRIEMSNTYKVDLRSRSDAQMAESVIGAELERKLQRRPGKLRLPPDYHASFRAPPGLSFRATHLNTLLDKLTATGYALGADGSPLIPAAIAGQLTSIGAALYRVGIGGLHSCEKGQGIAAAPGWRLTDIDVASFYPRIIINQRLFPAHLGPEFLRVYETIVEKRLAAKHSKQMIVAEALKIVINGSFGKFGSMYSIFYSPDLLLQVTISGQLYLLMLIEMIEGAGLRVVSANTDGIVIHYQENQSQTLKQLVVDWEQQTGLQTEETEYSAIYSRDVNNYIAFKPDGGVKTKGAYFIPKKLERLKKNPENQICIEAAIAHIKSGAPVVDFITSCNDMHKFVAVRKVAGGAVDEEQNYIGKTVRYYHARGKYQPLRYQTNNRKVGDSEGAKELMRFGAFPDDINYRWYINRTRQILDEIGFTPKPKALSFF